MATQRDLASRPASPTLNGGASSLSTDGGRGRDTRTKTKEGNVVVTSAEINENVKREQNHGQLKNFSMLSMIGLAYCILNSWTAMAASMSVVLPSGGPVAVLWGLCVSFIGVLSLAASLAEICHVYTTSGGPYHWAAILSPPSLAPIISWYTGWLACAGWTTLTATTGSLGASLILGAYALAHDSFEEQAYQIFVIFTGFMVLAAIINVYLPRLLPLINSAALTWSLAGAFIIVIVTLSCSGARGNDFQSAKFVFGTYINGTGWNGGVAWILGLLQSAFGLVGVDALSHMVEEIPEPHTNVPKAMILAVVVGASSSFVFLMVLLFVITDVTAVISSSAGALIETMYQSTQSRAGAICLAVLPQVSMLFAAQGIMCASSRMVHAFARDRGLPFSTFFSKLDRRTAVPNRAVLLVAGWCVVFALIYFGSSASFNAILSSSVVMLNMSYCVPIVCLLCRGRHLLRPESFPNPTFTLGPILGPLANIVALAFTALTTVFFVFPPELPVSGSSMNYAVAVFGIVMLLATGTWIFQGRKEFTGPRDLGGLLELARAEVNVEDGSRSRSHSRSRSRARHQGEVERKA
ncbi:hypothetical protein JCM8547_006381 [Rhodosporidiobolus lusitaniae]